MTGGDPKSAVSHGYIVNRDRDLATTWTKHKAITHYENCQIINFDLKRDHIVTPIETIANSALGIEAWALHDLGLMETPPNSSRLLTLHLARLHRLLVHPRRLYPWDAPDRIYDCMVRL